MRKFLFLLMTLPLLLTSLVLPSAAAYSYEEPVEPELWDEPDFSTDHAYSIAFVGDTQFLTCGDYYMGTKKLKQLYGIVAKTAKERKLAHVFALGDITHMGYRNDANLATTHYDPPLTGEWKIAQEAILQLSTAGVSYSLCRGNHDDYMIDDYFNIPAYTSQFKGVGGFYSDSEGKHPGRREKMNPDGYIYWSALTGVHKESIVNSYKTAELCGTKYLFLTVDYNPTEKVFQWVDRILSEYPDHLAILTTHSYLTSGGKLITSEKGDTYYPLGFTADKLWDQVLKNHKNLLMVVSGHIGVTKPVYSTQKGVHGNTVHQFLVDPQRYDVREGENGEALAGTQDSGMVLYMNFSADGKKVTFDYYSTLLNKEMVGTSREITLYDKSPAILHGDLDENETVDSDDAIHLLFHVMFPERYKANQSADFDKNLAVNADDAIYLLFHVMFPQRYPLLR